jgi:hypothetical protein
MAAAMALMRFIKCRRYEATSDLTTAPKAIKVSDDGEGGIALAAGAFILY